MSHIRQDGRALPRRRSRTLRIWLSIATPWLAAVVAMSIYDHKRAIGQAASAHLRASAAESPRNPGFEGMLQQASGSIREAAIFAFHWLQAAAEYAGAAILYYGLLPLGLTFVLFVLYLPWSARWLGQSVPER